MKHYHLDTNVVLRFLRKDDPAQSPAAADLFARADDQQCLLLISREVIAEAVWVLTSHYNADRGQVAQLLSGLLALPGIECDQGPAVLDALKRYSSTKLDIVDCLLVAVAAANGDPLATFDEGIRKRCPDIELWDQGGPGQA